MRNLVNGSLRSLEIFKNLYQVVRGFIRQDEKNRRWILEVLRHRQLLEVYLEEEKKCREHFNLLMTYHRRHRDDYRESLMRERESSDSRVAGYESNIEALEEKEEKRRLSFSRLMGE